MQQTAARLYLDLMKKTLSFALWPEPPVPLAGEICTRPAYQDALERIRAMAGKDEILVAEPRPVTDEMRADGTVWPAYAHTMIGLKRLDNLQHCVETALADGIEGDLIETGVWRGGACIFMRAVLAAYGVDDRKVFVADSFAGLPEPDDRYPVDAGDRHHTYSFLAVSQADVEQNFRKYGLLDEQVVFLPGWFEETLPQAPIAKLAVMRLDGDMYGSTIEALHALYPKLSPGGFCIIDDYGLKKCRQAVDDFRRDHGITADMVEVDWTGRYWRK